MAGVKRNYTYMSLKPEDEMRNPADKEVSLEFKMRSIRSLYKNLLKEPKDAEEANSINRTINLQVESFPFLGTIRGQTEFIKRSKFFIIHNEGDRSDFRILKASSLLEAKEKANFESIINKKKAKKAKLKQKKKAKEERVREIQKITNPQLKKQKALEFFGCSNDAQS